MANLLQCSIRDGRIQLRRGSRQQVGGEVFQGFEFLVADVRALVLLEPEEFFESRGHDVRFVRDLFPGGTPDPVIATIGDRLSAIVVTWDRDFEKLASRVPAGNRARFRKLGRISFRCNEARGVKLLDCATR